ncbi:MAG: hypothetical protein OEY49_09460 [Candidatus Heimdallarchaeota archaeon]|nr:hypothetical protein [Candidatus Heimdallarchaeota archaeon]
MSSGHEFTEEDNKVFNAVALRMNTQGILLVLGGILILINALINDSITSTKLLMNILTAIFVSVTGVVLFPAAKPFKSVVTSEGNDIKEVVSGFAKFNFAVKVITVMVLLTIVIDVINIIQG